MVVVSTSSYRKPLFAGCRDATSRAKLTAMKFSLEIREGLDGCVVHVKQSRNPNHILLTTAVSLVALYLFWQIPQPRITQVFVGCIILVLSGRDVISKWRGADVELCVTNLDLISTGNSPSGYRPSTIPRADIYDLQYREAQPGGGSSLICLKVCTSSTTKVCHGMHQPACFPMSEENRARRLSKG
jgi:hypothetical protein